MLAMDESAVLCDLAETYHVYDLKALPVKTLAALCAGLRDDSRIKLKISGMKHSFQTYMMAMAVDHLTLLTWLQTKDSQLGRNRPQSILQILFKEPGETVESFATAEEFEKARNEFFKKGE